MNDELKNANIICKDEIYEIYEIVLALSIKIATSYFELTAIKCSKEDKAKIDDGIVEFIPYLDDISKRLEKILDL